MNESPQVPGGPVYKPRPKSEGIGKYVILGSAGCLIFLAIIGAILLFVFQSTKDPVKVVNQQLQALRDGDVAKAYSLCSNAFQKNTNFSDFQTFVNSFPVLKNSKSFSSANREISSGVAKLKGSIQAADGSSQQAEYHLVKETGSWKIQYIYFANAAAQAQSQSPREAAPPSVSAPQPAPAPAQQRPATETGGGDQPQITELNVEKQSSGDMVAVRITFKVLNFKNDTSAGTARIHLVQDLETSGPDGSTLPDLSREGIKELQEAGKYQEYTYANFSNTLNIPSSYPQGNYRAKITVHDQIGNTSTNSSVDFQIP